MRPFSTWASVIPGPRRACARVSGGIPLSGWILNATRSPSGLMGVRNGAASTQTNPRTLALIERSTSGVIGARPMLELMRSGSVAAAVSGPAEQAESVRRRLAVRPNSGAAVRLLTLLGALDDDLRILLFHCLRSSL